MVSKVYFLDFQSEISNVLNKIDELFAASGVSKVIAKGDKVAVKMHFGERGNFRHIRPSFAAQIIWNIKQAGGQPFLTDTGTLGGSRSDAIQHLETATRHGFTASTIQAPVIIADGLLGQDYTMVEVQGTHFDTVRIASAAHNADCVISLAHFKGDLSGVERYWAATLKNIGMGLAAKAGKAAIHLMKPPTINTQCNLCKQCITWCPTGAISAASSKVTIDSAKCILCGDCVAFCPQEAVEIAWVFDQKLQEKYVEYAQGLLQNKTNKAAFFNFAMDITPLCDCAQWSKIPSQPDIGILASLDPVAVDQATFDLAMKQLKLTTSQEGKWSTQLAYAEKIGLGRRKYQLITI